MSLRERLPVKVCFSASLRRASEEGIEVLEVKVLLIFTSLTTAAFLHLLLMISPF